MYEELPPNSNEGLIGAVERDTSSAWSIPMLCIGIAVIAACILIPAADDNHKLLVENVHLQADLTQIRKQIEINDQFLKNVGDNPTLLERLAERQMKMVHDGESVLNVKAESTGTQPQMSPFLLLNLPPPAMALTENASRRDVLLSRWMDQPRIRLIAMGGALLLMATSLVLGAAPRAAHD